MQGGIKLKSTFFVSCGNYSSAIVRKYKGQNA